MTKTLHRTVINPDNERTSESNLLVEGVVSIASLETKARRNQRPTRNLVRRVVIITAKARPTTIHPGVKVRLETLPRAMREALTQEMAPKTTWKVVHLQEKANVVLELRKKSLRKVAADALRNSLEVATRNALLLIKLVRARARTVISLATKKLRVAVRAMATHLALPMVHPEALIRGHIITKTHCLSP
jgi:hypothetical protein